MVFCASYEQMAKLVDKGLLSKKYLDMATISQDEIPGLGLDRNTNVEPDKGFRFDGAVKPGTAFDHQGQ